MDEPYETPAARAFDMLHGEDAAPAEPAHTCPSCAPYPCHRRVPRQPVFIPVALTLVDREMARVRKALEREMDQTVLGAFMLPPDMVKSDMVKPDRSVEMLPSTSRGIEPPFTSFFKRSYRG
jgi:hypothetical protein